MHLSKHIAASAVLASLLAVTGASYAHGDETHVKPAGPVKMEQKDWGIAGEAKSVTRTIEITMTDKMRYTPDNIEIRQGETVRFIHRNPGQLKHEFVLGTKKDLAEHAALMKKFPNMEHEEPYMAHVAAGKTGEIIWAFNRPGQFDFACLMPGHYEAGMIGKIKVIATKVASN